jgi:hypothetical protein
MRERFSPCSSHFRYTRTIEIFFPKNKKKNAVDTKMGKSSMSIQKCPYLRCGRGCIDKAHHRRTYAAICLVMRARKQTPGPPSSKIDHERLRAYLVESAVRSLADAVAADSSVAGVSGATSAFTLANFRVACVYGALRRISMRKDGRAAEVDNGYGDESEQTDDVDSDGGPSRHPPHPDVFGNSTFWAPWESFTLRTDLSTDLPVRFDRRHWLQ